MEDLRNISHVWECEFQVDKLVYIQGQWNNDLERRPLIGQQQDQVNSMYIIGWPILYCYQAPKYIFQPFQNIYLSDNLVSNH